MHTKLADLVFNLVDGGMTLSKKAYCLECRSIECQLEKQLFNTAIHCEGNSIYRVGRHMD
jgi:hypothetical protein